MPLGRKHLRRNRDAPNLGWTMQRTASNLSRTRREVNVPKELDAAGWRQDTLPAYPFPIYRLIRSADIGLLTGRTSTIGFPSRVMAIGRFVFWTCLRIACR